ncbi:MAG: hypothetical protein CSB23_00645 [Deltaproteobacteria bacterium]|nr:MAG: hypothetical protein CSB23_00645 [Deltaproteobacteria bacterium]
MQNKNEILSELLEKLIRLKRSWGNLKGLWGPDDTRDAIVDFIRYWLEKTSVPANRMCDWMRLPAGK